MTNDLSTGLAEIGSLGARTRDPLRPARAAAAVAQCQVGPCAPSNALFARLTIKLIERRAQHTSPP